MGVFSARCVGMCEEDFPKTKNRGKQIFVSIFDAIITSHTKVMGEIR